MLHDDAVTAGGRGQYFAVVAHRFPGIPAEELRGVVGFAVGIVQGLAVLTHDALGDGLAVPAKQFP